MTMLTIMMIGVGNIVYDKTTKSGSGRCSFSHSLEPMNAVRQLEYILSEHTLSGVSEGTLRCHSNIGKLKNFLRRAYNTPRGIDGPATDR